MPSCFALTKKGQSERASLSEVDDRMREHFGAEPDSVKFYCGWYGYIGLSLAMGRTFNQIRDMLTKYNGDSSGPRAIVDWLDANYTVESWYQHK